MEPIEPYGTVLSFGRGRLRRAVASGDPALVVAALDVVLAEPPSEALYAEARHSLYRIWWFAAEDAALDSRLAALDRSFSLTTEKV